MLPAQLSEFIANHPMLAAAFVGIGIALIGNEISQLRRGYKHVSPAQLTQLMNQGNAVVIDVRAQNEFEAGHIVGSRHVALSQLDGNHKLLSKSKETPVALICRSGVSAATCAKTLVKAGYTNVALLEGGIGAWQQAELPLAKGKA